MSKTSKTIEKARQLHKRRHSTVDSCPLTIPMRLPTIEQQVREFTRLSAARREQLMQQAPYDNFDGPDDFQDHLDDLPREGLSPHEDPRSVILPTPPRKKKSKSSDAPKGAEPAIKKPGEGDPKVEPKN